MASSDSSSGGGSQLPNNKSDAALISVKFSKKLPRRQLTLISVTVCLNILLWSSIFVLFVSVYTIASDPDDTTNIPTEVLSIASSLVSVGYVVIHTIFSLKQRIWKHQRRHPSIINPSYVAVRFAVTLCILWLLTSGWNMITVARRPICLPDGLGHAGWESGTTCIIGRTSVAISCLALIASCTLFCMLAVLRRPFEAHVFRHGYRDSINTYPTPAVLRRSAPFSSISGASEKYRGRMSASTHRSHPSNISNVDVDTLDLGSNSPPATILAPSPVRSIGLDIFTSDAQPPPLPAAYISPCSKSEEASPLFVHATSSRTHLLPPPRMASSVAPSGFVPLSIPVQYSASAWRAVHPNAPSPLGPAATRSNPHLAHQLSGHSLYSRSGYSHSSVSLTRPSRLSTATPAGSGGWSSRSGSTGAEEGRGSPASGSVNSENERASANAIAYAILNGTSIPGTEGPRRKLDKKGHLRHVSAPAGSTTTGAPEEEARMAKGWKPQLQGNQQRDLDTTSITASTTSSKDTSTPRPQTMQSSSAELPSISSTDSSPEDNSVNLRSELERELDVQLASSNSNSTKRISRVAVPLRKTRSESLLRHSEVPVGNGAASFGPRVSSLAVNRVLGQKEKQEGDMGAGVGVRQERRTTFEEVKRKPLPKTAVL